MTLTATTLLAPDPDAGFGLPENFLPTAVPALLGQAGSGHHALIPVPVVTDSGAARPFIATDSATLADPEGLLALIGGSGDTEPYYIGPVTDAAGKGAAGPTAVPAGMQGADRKSVMVILDSGIAFWNRRFCRLGRRKLKSRFVRYGFVTFDTPAAPGPAVRFLNRRKLNRFARKGQTGTGEAHVMQKLGRKFSDSVHAHDAEAGTIFQSDGFNHGTAVADLAAGAYPRAADLGTADFPALVGIEMPTSVLLDASGETLQAVVSIALREAIAAATDWCASVGSAADIRIVLPFAFLAGLAGDTHPVIRNIERIVAAANAAGANVSVYAPTGNHMQDQLHGQLGDVAADSDSPSMRWFLAPDDHSPNTVEITFGGNAAQTLTLTSPEGESLAVAFDSGQVSTLHQNGQTIGALWCRTGANGRISLRVALAGTEMARRGGAVLPTGDWQLSLRARNGALQDLKMWILREDGTRFNRRPAPARQSHFRDSAYQLRAESGGYLKSDTPGTLIRREGTASLLTSGNGAAIQSVGAQEKLGGAAEVAWYSGQLQGFVAPDHMMLVDDGYTSRGVPAAGNGGPRRYRMSGSSAAVAMAARFAP